VTRILHILQHAIGRDAYGRQTKNGGEDYRNHFVAGVDDVITCREAVTMGLMAEHVATPISGGEPWFHVTDAGKAYITEHSPEPPKLTRGQQRYQRYLIESDYTGETFGDWIKRAPREVAS
jgi:hypothetical protein